LPAAERSLLFWLEPVLKAVARPVVRGCVRFGIPPNALTLCSLAGNGAVALLLASGQFRAGGVTLLLVNAFDVLDGEVARASGKVSAFGAFLDSVCDRYADLLVFLGLFWRYGLAGELIWQTVTFTAAGGALAVSYARARAEGLGLAASGGAVQRLERVIFLGVGLLLPVAIFSWLLAVLAIASHATAVQRILIVRRELQAAQHKTVAP
jgi:CDP-diacylglycerol---glycerol-3-phosphate 3-phosphatidyltransferase